MCPGAKARRLTLHRQRPSRQSMWVEERAKAVGDLRVPVMGKLETIVEFRVLHSGRPDSEAVSHAMVKLCWSSVDAYIPRR